ncbi:acyltransferase-domain-containing protein [Obba rivulosa]|uniref:Tafazzin family protein n=1 Tax=Obba rivulosa TaxID=1052685 RepID=A0A8E2ATN5_9APHY|nr:acyltransferase-domain-containing protein [Obba rivulosa]
MSSLTSKATVGTIGLVCKAFLNSGYCSSVTVNGLDNLINALHSSERSNGRGVITMANHISTLDEPVVWGILPWKYYFNTHLTRWTLGASDIMFTNPVFSEFFRQGQVLETFRGDGIYQPAVDTAIEKLNAGAWIHLFGEGKVNQPENFDEPSSLPLLRFKWGVYVSFAALLLSGGIYSAHSGRIIMEAAKPPIIIPMWLTGFHTLMPEGRPFPWKFLPRYGAKLSVSFGPPVRTGELEEILRSSVEASDEAGRPAASLGVDAKPLDIQDEVSGAETTRTRWMRDIVTGALEDKPPREAGPQREEALRMARVRSAVAAVVQRYVEALGQGVSQNLRRD